MEVERWQFGGNDPAGYLQPSALIEDSYELSLPYCESPAPAIGLHGFPNDCKTLCGPAHEIEGNAFPRRPADRIAGHRDAMTGEDNCAKLSWAAAKNCLEVKNFT